MKILLQFGHIYPLGEEHEIKNHHTSNKILPATTSATEAHSNSQVFKPVNEKVETQAYYLAATEGANAASSFLEKTTITLLPFKRRYIVMTLSR